MSSGQAAGWCHCGPGEPFKWPQCSPTVPCAERKPRGGVALSLSMPSWPLRTEGLDGSGPGGQLSCWCPRKGDFGVPQSGRDGPGDCDTAEFGFLLPYPLSLKPAFLPVVSAPGVASSRCLICCPPLGHCAACPPSPPSASPGGCFCWCCAPSPPLSLGTGPSSAWQLGQPTLTGSIWSQPLTSEAWRAAYPQLPCAAPIPLVAVGPDCCCHSCLLLLWN